MSDPDNVVTKMFKIKDLKVHFEWDFLTDQRQYTLCILETSNHLLFSGVAIVHPREYLNQNIKVGWKISLKRACHAATFIGTQEVYKKIWSEIRLQLRNEHLAKEEESIKKILEEENG